MDRRPLSIAFRMMNNIYAITIGATTIGHDLSPASPARVLYCTLSRGPPIHHLSTLATVQSEAINGFFIRLVKSFYIKAGMAARMHQYGGRDAELPIDDHSSCLLSASLCVSSIFYVFHLFPRERMKLDGIILSSSVMILSLSLNLSLSLSFLLQSPIRLRISSAWRLRLETNFGRVVCTFLASRERVFTVPYKHSVNSSWNRVFAECGDCWNYIIMKL